MKFLFAIFMTSLCLLQACDPSSKFVSTRQSSAGIPGPGNRRVLVAAHRGDWRGHPENSLPALSGAIALGADIAEFDLKMTRDGVLIIMHDKTIDRTTDGKGRPEDFTLQELQQFHLRNGLGRPTTNRIPTFAQYLDSARGRILMDVDKGLDYFPAVVRLLRDKGMLDQAMINVDDNSTLDQVELRFGVVPPEVWLMPIVDYADSAKARILVNSYRRHQRTIFQPIWKDDRQVATADFNQLRKDGYGIWLNSLWPSLNGGHDDDRAVETLDPAGSWGWLLSRGATVLQTDRPVALLKYLQEQGLR